jgi:hypothetical protein
MEDRTAQWLMKRRRGQEEHTEWSKDRRVTVADDWGRATKSP